MPRLRKAFYVSCHYMTIQETISRLTIDLWDNIALSEQLKTKYGEETISNILLLELAKLRNYNVRIIQTPKDKEKVKGTDWEWFIGSQAYGWTRFAVQAKKGDPKNNGYYNCLGHIVDSERQIDILKRFAKANNAIPLYTFYNHVKNANEADHWHCKQPYSQKLLGWTITSIENVESALATRGGRDFDSIHKKTQTLPTKCLFECPIFLQKFQDKSLTNEKVTFFNTEVTKLQSLPGVLINQRDIMIINDYPEELYNTQIEIYPERIAIFDIGNNIDNGS
jgi:hypothetical protein